MLTVRESLAAQDPGNAEWRESLALALYASAVVERQLDHLEAAEALLARFDTLSPGTTEVHWQHSAIAFARRQYDAAVLHAAQAVDILRGPAAVDAAQRPVLAQALGSLSGYHLFAGTFPAAKAAAQEALSIDDSQLWIETNLAHALLFLGDTEAATRIYLGNVGRRVDERSWTEAVLDDFRQLRAAGRAHPAMDAVERALAAAPSQ